MQVRWINGYDIRYKSIPIYSRVILAGWHVGNSDTLPVKYASGGKYADYDCSIQDIGGLDMLVILTPQGTGPGTSGIAAVKQVDFPCTKI